MSQTSARALVWRARIAGVVGERLAMGAPGGGCRALGLLPARPGRCRTASSPPAAIALLVIGAAVTSSKPMAIALMAMPALFVVQRVGLGGSELSVSDVVLAAAFGTAVLLGTRPVQPTDAAAALAEPLLPVHDAVHGHREPLRREHGRVVPRLASRLGRAGRRLGAGPRRATRGSRCC